MADIYLVQGNTGKTLRFRMMVPDPLDGSRLVPLDLTAATSIAFRMWAQTGCSSATLGGTGAKYGPPMMGGVSYDVQTTDVVKAGLYWAAFDANYPGGSQVTLPEGRYLSVLVMPRQGRTNC